MYSDVSWCILMYPNVSGCGLNFFKPFQLSGCIRMYLIVCRFYCCVLAPKLKSLSFSANVPCCILPGKVSNTVEILGKTPSMHQWRIGTSAQSNTKLRVPQLLPKATVQFRSGLATIFDFLPTASIWRDFRVRNVVRWTPFSKKGGTFIQLGMVFHQGCDSV